MNEEQQSQNNNARTNLQNESTDNKTEQSIPNEAPLTTNNSPKNKRPLIQETEKNTIYAQSFAGLSCLVFIFILFFHIANEENWYKMTSSCGHTRWLAFFLFGVPLFIGAISFEISALSRRRNHLSALFLVAIVLSAIILLIIYSNMSSTVGGC